MKEQTKYTKPSNGSTLLRLAFVLLMLVILSVYMMGGLLAKYNATGSGADDARVAKFHVVAQGIDPNAVTVSAKLNEDTGTYSFKVENHAEVAVKYDVLLSYATHLPGVSAKLDGKEITWIGTSNLGFPNAGTLAPGATSGEHKLVFTMDWEKFTESVRSQNIHEKTVNFTVKIFVEQVD